MRPGSSLRSFGALAEYRRCLLRGRGREAQGPARLGASAVDALGRPGSTPETPGPLAIAFGLGDPAAPARPVGPPRPGRRGRPRAVARCGGGRGVRQANAVESQALTIAASVRALIAFHLRDSPARKPAKKWVCGCVREGTGGGTPTLRARQTLQPIVAFGTSGSGIYALSWEKKGGRFDMWTRTNLGAVRRTGRECTSLLQTLILLL